MTKLSLNIAQRVFQLIQGETIPYGQLKGELINQMIEDGILHIKLQGRSRKLIYATKPEAVSNYLSSNLGVSNLNTYISNLENGTSRAENIIASSNSKSSLRRTFKGFLVNSFCPVVVKVNGHDYTVNPPEGTYTYIHDFENFTISPDTLVVGIENPENFRFINKQAHLFNADSILFVSRYPQSNDLITWLQNIPNSYLHFGDFDFAGIRIFRDEYYQYLPHRASYFIPNNIDKLINRYGNKSLYNHQYKTKAFISLSLNDDIEALIALFHKYKKCLEQEVLIKVDNYSL